MNPNRQPRIVVTVSDPARNREPELAARKNDLYADAVRRCGAEAIVLHAGAAPEERDAAIRAMDGLVITGGPDLDPALYGEEARGSDGVERERDDLELAAWAEAARHGVPVLGICRGFQAVNVFSGGKLIQHVDGHAGPGYGHGGALRHEMRLAPGSRLARILGSESRLVVNSYHHQAVDPAELAPGLVASAWAESPAGAIVEGLEAADGRWLVAVQCHPERVESTPAEFDRLWASFVEAARERVRQAEQAPSA